MNEPELLEAVRAAARPGRRASLGVVGGTFDPVHLGHVAMGRAARDELGLDGLLFMPAGVPSFKREARLAPAVSRVEMVRLATAGLSRCAVSDREVMRPGVTYTADTLRELAGELPGVCIVFVLGADSLETLSLWHDAASIARLADVAVARRRGHDLAPALRALARSGLGFRIRELACELPDVSSTLVRAAVAAGLDVAPFVGDVVAGYIRSTGLYHDAQAAPCEAVTWKGRL